MINCDSNHSVKMAILRQVGLFDTTGDDSGFERFDKIW